MYHRKPVAHTRDDGRRVPGVVERLVQLKVGGLRCEATEVVPVGASHSGGGHSRVPKEAGGAKARHYHLVGQSRHPNGACDNRRPYPWGRRRVQERLREGVQDDTPRSPVRCYPLQRGGPGSDAEAQHSLERGYESAFDEDSSRVPRTNGKAVGWSQYAMSLEWVKGYCQQAGDPNAVCCIANIHVDPWDDIPIEVTEPPILMVEAPCSSNVERAASPRGGRGQSC